MMRRLTLFVTLGLFLFTLRAWSQTSGGASAPAFDVVDVHVRAHSSNPNPNVTGGVLRNGRYDLRNATMVDMIRTAYNVTDPDTIVGGPSWLETDRFDIIGKAPDGTSPDTLKLMVQSVLADRFKLVLHKDTRSQVGYALTVGNGGKHKLTQAAAEGAGCQGVPNPPAPGAVPQALVSCHGMTMEKFAPLLRLFAGAYISNPVVDQTGLQGAWDFDLRWTGRALLTQAGADGISIFDAVDKQLGLKLTEQTVPMPVLVVDSVNQRPTDNPSGVAQNLPSPPPGEFDLATIKLSMPGTMPIGRIQPGGRIDLQGFTLRLLLSIAWNLPPNNNDLIANPPKWMDDTRYNILAVTSTAVSGAGNQQQQIDIDDLRLMLQTLIKERFKLAVHMEERPVSAYTLTATRQPKLTRADPTSRTRWKEGPAPNATNDPRNTNPILARLVTVQNMTMTQFAESLQAMAGGYVTIPVNDETGLQGSWDFTFNFTPIGLLNNGNAAGRGGDGSQAAGGAPVASDPNGAMSLPDALEKQLGLKLETRKRMIPVLVIDRVDEQPSNE